MINRSWCVPVAVAVTALFGCSRRNVLDCAGTSICAEFPGGVCRVNPATGSSWCAVPDAACSSGLSWTEEYTGDGLEGTCVETSGGDAATCEPMIAWERDEGATHHVWIAAPDGSAQRRLTTGIANKPMWSPDGGRIVYDRADGTAGGISIVDVVTLQDTPLTELDDHRPSWSPDGTLIAFSRQAVSGTAESIWTIPAGGGAAIELVQPEAIEMRFSWSPDGTQLAYQSRGDGDFEIYVINRDGSGQRNLTNSPASADTSPSWSPDGVHIVFRSNREGSNDLWRMDADGSNPINLQATAAGGSVRDLDWFPDGARLLYTLDLADPVRFDMHVMNVDGTGQTRIEDGDLDVYPHVSPDGRRITWSRVLTAVEDAEIYVSDSDGESPLRITNFDGIDTVPRWRPCP